MRKQAKTRIIFASSYIMRVLTHEVRRNLFVHTEKTALRDISRTSKFQEQKKHQTRNACIFLF
jgi:hypothetical protein